MNRRGGFTLVELLLTLGVLAVGLTSVFALLPGIAGRSRDLRDEAWMQETADRFFASVDWAHRLAEDGSFPSGVSPMLLSTLAGDQELRLDGQEHPWPQTPLAESLFPTLYYRLTLETTEPRRLEAVLQLRPETRAEAISFRYVVSPERAPW